MIYMYRWHLAKDPDNKKATSNILPLTNQSRKSSLRKRTPKKKEV